MYDPIDLPADATMDVYGESVSCRSIPLFVFQQVAKSVPAVASKKQKTKTHTKTNKQTNQTTTTTAKQTKSKKKKHTQKKNSAAFYFYKSTFENNF